MTLGAYVLKNFCGVEGIETIGDRFTISSEIPDPALPSISWEVVKNLISPAITIAVLGAIESLLSAAVADGYIGDRHNSNQELRVLQTLYVRLLEVYQQQVLLHVQ